MGQYLDKFSGTINQLQAQQIIKLLNKKRNQGQVRNLREFSKQLESLMKELSSTVLQPTTKLFLALANDLISAEQFNFMLDRVEDDLSAAFAEAISIDTVQSSHETIVRDVILKNLRAGIAELESKISLYEILNRDTNGFDTAIFSTFRESKDSRITSGSIANKTLFLDPRIPTNLSEMEDASLEIVGERLVLGEDNVIYHNISGIKQLFASEVPQSALIVNAPQTSLINIIDNTKGTYWIQSVLVSKKQDSIKVKLELDLGIKREINFIEIEPITRHDLILESIHYINNGGVTTEVSENEITFDGAASFKIRKISTRKLILTFRNEHFIATQFEYKEKENLFTQALTQPAEGFESNITLVNDELDEIINSIEVKDTIGIKPLTIKEFNGYEFTTGIDNIRVGLATYTNQSIYVSKPIELDTIGQIGLKTVESRPYRIGVNPQFTTSTYEDNDFYLGSIEYWISKRDFNIDGSLLRTTKFPILPLGVERIYHERLILTEKSDNLLAAPDIGFPIFMTSTNINVYRNGQLLTDVTGESEPSDGWQNISTTADKSPNSGNRMRTRIKIISQLPGDIFTISYDIRTSTTRNIPNSLPIITDPATFTGLGIVDLVGDLSAYADDNQLITLNNPDALNTIAKTKIYLIIVLRRNTSDVSLSAAVEEYTLMVGEQNLSKYEDT